MRDLRVLFVGKKELGVEKGCLLWGARVVILLNFRGKVLNQLNSCHFGVSRMKAFARSYIWWPNIDRNIEQTVKNCQECQLNANSTTKVLIYLCE